LLVVCLFIKFRFSPNEGDLRLLLFCPFVGNFYYIHIPLSKTGCYMYWPNYLKILFFTLPTTANPFLILIGARYNFNRLKMQYWWTSINWRWKWHKFPWFKKTLIYLKISSIQYCKRFRPNWIFYTNWLKIKPYKIKTLTYFSMVSMASLMSHLHTSEESRECNESRVALRRIRKLLSLRA
jgi:hypothetical protein